MVNKKSKIEIISSFVFRHRLSVFLFILIFGLVFSFGATRIKNEVILSDLFPYDHPYLKIHSKFSKIFGGGGYSVIIAVMSKEGDIFKEKVLRKVKEITDDLLLRDEVYRVLTVSIATNTTKVVKMLAKGEIRVQALMFPDIPKTTEEMDLLKKNIFSDPAFNGVLVSRDGTGALILTQVKETISYGRAFKLFRYYQEKYSDEDAQIRVVGFPVLMGWITSYKTQMYWVFGISVALMVLILYAIFRNFVGMIAPIAISIYCTGLGLGFIGWTGINFSPLLYVLAFLVGARMLSNAVQITNRYLHEYHINSDQEMPRREAGFRTMRAMLMPNAAAVATDAAGFLILGIAKIVIMQQLAVLMSFWMLTIILSGLMVPIICSYLPRLRPLPSAALSRNPGKEAVPPGGKLDPLGRLIVGMADFSTGRGKYFIGLLVLAVLLFGVWETTKLKVGDPTPGSPILWPDHTYNQDQAVINNKFDASSESLMLFYEGEEESIYEPEVINTFVEFDRYMEERLPDIYKSSTSLIDMLKKFLITHRDGDPVWYQIPSNEDHLMGVVGIMRAALAKGILDRFFDSTSERTLITLFFSDHTTDNMLRIRQASRDFFKDRSLKTEKGEFKLPGGSLGLELALNEEMQRTHAKMDLLVLGVIFIMCVVAFRSFVAGAMLALPLLLSNLAAFAYMSINDIGLSVNTLPCSAVGVGVGVDFAIYLYSRCMEEFPKSQDWEKTVHSAVTTAGKGIVFTGVTLIFPIITWYFISALKFQAQMGFFLSMLLFINMVAALTLHPLLIVWLKPRFMMKRATLTKE